MLAPADERAGVTDEPPEEETEHAASTRAAPTREPPPRPSAAPRPAASATGVEQAHDPQEPGMLPHPMDPERERLHAENALIAGLNEAMTFRNVKRMRELVAEYRKLDPTDVHSNQLGYEIIADCIEFRGDASLAAARQFYDRERHSTLRRYVRRICFENTN